MTKWNPELIQRYNVPGPRYVSYPPATSFHEEITPDDYWRALELGNQARRPLSLYMHIPFCEHVCYYCACHRVVTADHGRASEYLQFLMDEISLKAARLDRQRPVTQLHWGGGTPTYLSDPEMTSLVYHTARNFHLLDDDRGDYSVEIDPRTVTEKRIGLLRGLGFNRASLGVQDLDPQVQKAVNRIQPFEQVREVFGWLRDHDFRSINVDLMYGLPWQSESSMARTVTQLLALRPARVSLFNYAHMPERFKVQRQINELTLPSADEKSRMLASAAALLGQAGYQLIGMDQFALPEDSLAIASQDGSLQRHFQGYSLHGDADLVAFGSSAISQLDTLYAQNHISLPQWMSCIADGELPLERGYVLDADDRIRRDLIMTLLCRMHVDLEELGRRWGIVPAVYFASELASLRELERDGLVVASETQIILTDAGRPLARAVAMQFDRYLARPAVHARHSRII